MDVLFHLRREQLVLRAEEVESLDVDGQAPATDMMASLARHILQQRRFVFMTPCWTLFITVMLVSIHCFQPLSISHTK